SIVFRRRSGNGMLTLVFLLPGGVDARPVAANPVDYLRDVKLILAQHCTTCHGAVRQEASLRLDAASLIRKGGESGPALVAGKSAESLILDAVTGNGVTRMPLEGEPLADPQIELLRRWLDQGPVAPAEKPPEL